MVNSASIDTVETFLFIKTCNNQWVVLKPENLNAMKSFNDSSIGVIGV